MMGIISEDIVDKGIDKNMLLKSRRVKKHVIITYLIVLVTVFTISACKQASFDEYGNTNGNIHNHGTVCDDGEFIYYTRKNKIYRSDISGNNIKLLYEADKGKGLNILLNLNVSNKYIYYQRYGDVSLSRINKDGSNYKLISENVYTGPLYYDGWLYYMGPDKAETFDTDEKDEDIKFFLYRTDINGMKKNKMCEYTPVRDVAMNLNIYNGYIYFNSEEGLVRIKLDGSDRKVISQGYKVIISDGFIYNYTNDGLFRMKINSEDEQKISNEDINRFNVNNDWIYYDSNDGLYRMKVDGSEKQKLDDNNFGFISTTKDKIIVDDGSFYIMNFDGSEKKKLILPKQ